MSLKPQLKHNREEFDRLRRRKYQALLVMALSVFPVVLLTPVEIIAAVVWVLLVAGVSAFLYFDFKRFQVYRRDLRERGDPDVAAWNENRAAAEEETSLSTK